MRVPGVEQACISADESIHAPSRGDSTAARAGRPPGKKPHETRARVLDCIIDQPGISKTQLAHNLTLSWGAISHHVDALLTNGLIQQDYAAGRGFLFPSTHTAQEMRIMCLLQDQGHASIVEQVAARPGVGYEHLREAMPMRRSLFNKRLAALIQAGVLDASKDRVAAYRVQPWLDHHAVARP